MNRSHLLAWALSLIMLLPTASLRARANDSLVVSLITCAPGERVYELYGHTALRVRNLSSGYDWVFNYGMFSFDTPCFVGRFLTGSTDYYVGAIPYGDFAYEYLVRGSSITEQTLNLSQIEAWRLATRLDSLVKLQGWTYRYNFLYDNCTTRARDQIETALSGHIVYPETDKRTTWRQIIHEYTKNHPWDEFGQDLLLGAEADRSLDGRQMQSFPLYLEHFFERAWIAVDGGEKHPLVVHTETLEATPRAEGFSAVFKLFTPFFVSLVVLALTLGLGWWQVHKMRVLTVLDLSFMAVQGLVGCLLFFMFFFSVHPCVSSNWLIWVLNPLPLLYLPRRAWLLKKKRKDPYPWIAGGAELLFLLFAPMIPQYFQPAILVLACALFVQSAVDCLVQHKQIAKPQ